jgi:hypothetical protein
MLCGLGGLSNMLVGPDGFCCAAFEGGVQKRKLFVGIKPPETPGGLLRSPSRVTVSIGRASISASGP